MSLRICQIDEIHPGEVKQILEDGGQVVILSRYAPQGRGYNGNGSDHGWFNYLAIIIPDVETGAGIPVLGEEMDNTIDI